MLNNLTSQLDFHAQALVLRGQRQQLLASNIANADTPGYVAKDINFKQAMETAQGSRSSLRLALTPSQGSASAGHIALGNLSGSSLSSADLSFAMTSQPSLDNNSVDLDRERATFADNAVRYESTLSFISSQAKTLLAAIQGQ